MTERFQVVTNNFNANPRATFKTDHKHAKDRFQLLAKSFEALDKKRATETGTEEVLTPMELLLVDVVEEMNRFNERAAAERKEGTEAEEELVKNGEQVRRLAMATRGEGASASTLTTSNRSSGGGLMEPSPTRRRGHPEDFDDAEFMAVLERSEKRKPDMATRELALRERQLAHDEAVLAEARLRREEESRSRVEQETRSAMDAAAARQTNVALARIMERLSKQMVRENMHAGLLFASSWCQQPCRRCDSVRVCVGCRFGADTFRPAHEVVRAVVLEFGSPLGDRRFESYPGISMNAGLVRRVFPMQRDIYRTE